MIIKQVKGQKTQRSLRATGAWAAQDEAHFSRFEDTGGSDVAASMDALNIGEQDLLVKDRSGKE